MADPLSLSGTAVGIISLGLQVTHALYEYYHGIKSQSSDIKDTTRKLDSLIGLLETLQKHIKGRKFRSDEQELTRKIDALIKECEECIKELQEESDKFKQYPVGNLQAILKTTARRIAYPFRKSTLEKLDEDIDDVVDRLKLALQLLQQEVTDRVQDDLEDVKTLLNLIRSSQVSEGLRRWLGAPDPTINFNSACSRRHPNTGLWLVQGDAFSTWLRSPGSFLWLRGFAGCGKSVLCSTAIQHTYRFRRSDPKIGIAFFFFTFNDESKQDASAMLRSLILQFSAQSPNSHLARLRDSYTQSVPPDHALLNCLHQLVLDFKDVYLLVDALDESPRDKHREAMLQVLTDINAWQEDRLHLLVTSRNEIDIREELDPPPELVIDMKNDEVNKDIATFIIQSLRDNRKYIKWKKHHTIIQEALTKKANGMFRWVECQLKSIAHCPPNQSLLEKLLHSLPDTLDETYARMLQNISPELQMYAQQMFTILSSSLRPLTEVQLLDALAVEPDIPCKFDATRRFDETSALEEICPGFVEVSIFHQTGEPVVRIAHFSVQEFLEADRILLNPDIASFHISKQKGHSYMASTCLAFLTNSQTIVKHNKTDDWLYPFVTYAARYWTEHLQVCDAKDEIEFQALPLFQDLLLFDTWISIWNIDDLHYGSSRYVSKFPLYYAALVGLNSTIHKILDQECARVPDEAPQQAVGRAVNTCGAGQHGTPLSAAAASGHKDTVALLLQQGADINLKGGKYGSALQIASKLGDREIVELLVNNGAILDPKRTVYGTPLSIASLEGYKEIVKLLLECGADVNTKEGGAAFGAPLYAASSKGHIEIVEQLLRFNPTVNDVSGLHGTALQAAAFDGYGDIVKLLLANSADVNITKKDGTTALQGASYRGNKDMVKLLLDNGADINAPAGSGSLGTALQAASWNGHKEVVELLLENGADVNVDGYAYGTSLQAAAFKNHKDIVKLLLDYGADVNISGVRHNPALQMAVSNSERDIVKVMLENGANVNLTGGQYGTALSAASLKGDMGIVRLLLIEGADVNIIAGNHDTALCAASFGGHIDIVQLLISRGARIDIWGPHYHTALQAASSQGHDEMMEFLIERGANTKVKIKIGYEDLDMLSAESYERHKKVVDLLKDKRAEVYVVDYSKGLI